jgi:hypothetical protein
LATLGQGRWEPERPAQIRFLPRHLTIIALVVKTCQMENPMQHQDFHFEGGRMTEARRILQGNFGRDRNLSGKSFSVAIDRRIDGKRQDIRGFVLPAEPEVQRAHGGACGHDHVHRSSQSSPCARSRDKTGECFLAKSRDLLFENHQAGILLCNPRAVDF